jgi:ATP-dependent Clp protease ATP-binding subunit ClpC
MRDQEGMGAQVLQNLGLEIDKVRAAIASVLGRDEQVTRRHGIIPTSRVKKVIEIAFEEARRRDSHFVGPEHLLLALVIEGQGLAAGVLNDMGATRSKIDAEITRPSAASES